MNEKFFSQINSNNVAYWIGFIAADGTISIKKHKLSFGLSIKDKDQLEKFKATIGCQNVITERDTLCTNGKRYRSCYLSIYSEQIISDLLQYGIEERKSFKDIDFLSFIPEQYKFSFICGFFDGDGWFVNTNKNIGMGICGTQQSIESTATFLRNYFSWNKLVPHKDNSTKATFYLQTSSKYKLFDFINAYLEQDVFCDLLNRKKQTALEIKETLNVFMQNQKLNQKAQIIRHTKICPICNKEFYIVNHLTQQYCSYECAQKAQRRVKRPSRDEFKQLIRTTPFTTIGKQFGVSDTAIRKWCDSYNLPRKVAEIKKYSDEEWELL